MRFCPSCKKILFPKKKNFACACGHVSHAEKIILKKEKFKNKEIEVIDEDNEHIGDAVMDIPCWNCGNIGVYFWMVQMRRADEPPTRFYKCKKCKKVWRSGK